MTPMAHGKMFQVSFFGEKKICSMFAWSSLAIPDGLKGYHDYRMEENPQRSDLKRKKTSKFRGFAHLSCRWHVLKCVGLS